MNVDASEDTQVMEILSDVYWTEKTTTDGSYYGLHNDGYQSWINMYKDDGKFVARVNRCFDYKGLVNELKADKHVKFVEHKGD